MTFVASSSLDQSAPQSDPVIDECANCHEPITEHGECYDLPDDNDGVVCSTTCYDIYLRKNRKKYLEGFHRNGDLKRPA